MMPFATGSACERVNHIQSVHPMTWRILLAAAALVIACSARVSAHPAPFSYLDIVFRNGGIDGTLVVHIIDIAHDLGIEPVDRLLDDRLVQSEKDRIGNL